ncbi:hypothetical protein AAMO2058_000049200 [Amorphochlora amoebiformis]
MAACIVMVRVYRARNLPVMDSARNTTDAYVLLRIGDNQQKAQTRICYNSLNPVWNETFRFKVLDESVIYESPLQLTVFDKDTFSANDPIGSVVIGLGNLLNAEKSQQRVTGWFPLYDTLKGIVGQLFAQVRIQRIAGSGVQIFAASQIHTFEIIRYHGMVDELIVSADPEHRWQGLISGARKTNESRQLLFYKMAGQVLKSVSRKSQALGANAILGYRFDIDFEGSHGVIARGYGTACTLRALNSEEGDIKRPSERKSRIDPGLFPKSRISQLVSRPRKRKFAIEFLTVQSLPAGKAKYLIGGAVNARAVKLITGKRSKQQLRDEWWDEIRAEMRTHGASLQCSHILGYKERAIVFEDVCVLSASGTAIRILAGNLNRYHRKTTTHKGPCHPFHSPFMRRSHLSKTPLARCKACLHGSVPETLLSTIPPPPDPYYQLKSFKEDTSRENSSKDFPMILPNSRQLVEARVCRQVQKLQGDAKAIQVSQSILFLQYDLFRQLIYKLRVLGLNAAFGLTVQISIGENLIAAVATATGCYLTALPPPAELRISRNMEIKDSEDRELFAIQKKIVQEGAANHQHWQKELEALSFRFHTPPSLLRHATAPPQISPNPSTDNTSASPAVSKSPSPLVLSNPSMSLLDAKPLTILAAAAGAVKGQVDSSSSSSDSEDEVTAGRRKFVLHVDDEADEDVMAVLSEPRMEGFINTPLSPHDIDGNHIGASRLLTFIRRVRWGDVPSHKLNQTFASVFLDLYASLQYKSQGYACNVQSQLNIPEENEIEIVLMAVALPEYAHKLRLGMHLNGVRDHNTPAPAAQSGANISNGLKMPAFRKSTTDPIKDEKIPNRRPCPQNNSISSPNFNPKPISKLLSPPDAKDLRSSKLPSLTEAKALGSKLSVPRLSSSGVAGGVPRLSSSRVAGGSSEKSRGEWLIPSYNGVIPTIKLPDKIDGGLERIRLGEITNEGGWEGRLLLKRWPGYSHVQLSTLERLPMRTISQYLGRVSVHFIRESFEEKRGFFPKLHPKTPKT